MREKYEKAKETLAKALKELGQNPKDGHRPTSSRFIIWFIHAWLTNDWDRARNAVTDGANDKGCDAVLIDEQAEKVFVVQAKHSAHFGKPFESPDAIKSFATLGDCIWTDDDASAENLLRDANPLVVDKLREARKFVQQGFGLGMLFVTCKRASAGIKEDFKSYTGQRGMVIGADALADIITDWEKGVAPPIHELRLKMDSEKHVRYEDQRTDEEKVDTWIFQMRGDELARLANFGPRIFNANVRGDLKKTSVSEAMEKTLNEKDGPQNFFHRNNGVTISCRGAELIKDGVLRVRSPQIINGQQTTRTLAKFAVKKPGQVAAARVLTRVFVEEHGDKLVSSVVEGVNRQNPIKASDLFSNDPKQVDLERELRKIDIGYQRKRGRETKLECKARLQRDAMPIVRRVYKKEEFAKAVAVCNLDPAKVPSGGLDNLFRSEYEQLFPSDDPYYYLSRRSLVEAATAGARGNEDRSRAIWVTTGFMWKELESIVAPKQRQFFDMWLSRDWMEGESMKKALGQAIEMVFVEVLKFYREERRNTPREKRKATPAAFFKNTRDLAGKFRRFWRDNASARKQDLFAARLEDIRSALNRE